MSDTRTIPEGLRARIAKLMALASDARGNENEAAAASAKVQSLLREYNLEMSQITETVRARTTPETVRACIAQLDKDIALIRAASCDIEAYRLRQEGSHASAKAKEKQAAGWREKAAKAAW